MRNKRRLKEASMAALSPTKSTPSVAKSVSIILSPDVGIVTGGLQSVAVPPPTRVEVKTVTETKKAGSAKKKRTLPLEKNEAASIIQQAWRRHIVSRIEQYHTDIDLDSNDISHFGGLPQVIFCQVRSAEAKYCHEGKYNYLGTTNTRYFSRPGQYQLY